MLEAEPNRSLNRLNDTTQALVEEVEYHRGRHSEDPRNSAESLLQGPELRTVGTADRGSALHLTKASGENSASVTATSRCTTPVLKPRPASVTSASSLCVLPSGISATSGWWTTQGVSFVAFSRSTRLRWPRQRSRPATCLREQGTQMNLDHHNLLARFGLKWEPLLL